MAYPVKVTGSLAVRGDPGSKDRVTVPFGPVRPGLINVVLIAHHGPQTQGGEPQPAVIDVIAEIFPPGISTPALRLGRPVPIPPGELNEAIFSGDTPASHAQASAPWTAIVSNHNTDLTANFEIKIRFQTQDGNLGKIDHVIVVMLENRSFDHMLGYLKAQNVIPGVEGLAGTEFNRNNANVRAPVHALTRSTFFNDPGHGWPDVAGPIPHAAPDPHAPSHVQLEGDSGAGLQHNAGFVKNFILQLQKETAAAPHNRALIGPGQTHIIVFQPKAAGNLGVRSVPQQPPKTPPGNSLGRIVIKDPSGIAFPNSNAFSESPIGLGVLSAQVTLQPTQVFPGFWTCEITNHTSVALTFVTDITNANDVANEETEDAVMGFHTAQTVPTYDFLARNYVVCDHWFASIPTDTFPNRLYSMAGGAGGLLLTPSDADVAKDAPGYNLKTIFEVLQSQGVDWNIFYSDLPFALVFTGLARDAEYTSRMLSIENFTNAARTGDLPSFAWIDPNFNDVPDGTANASDDHPPGDVARGQHFVSQVYNTLANSPTWSKTLLIVTYDEHGGFFDHVRPPGTPAKLGDDPVAKEGVHDDDAKLRRYGIRVPTFLVSPWVEPAHVAKKVYDHTSTLRSVLLRFCRSPNTPSMGARTDNANDLGSVLTRTTPRPPVHFAARLEPMRTSGTVTSSPLEGIGTTIRRRILGF